ncbi:MAG: glycosyltransferase [Gammaproteobacteria bacterium]|nr:glycosyltransferase [Gammaproteobacteria bacterium]
MPDISIVIPVLDEAREIAACLQPLQTWRAAGHEVIVVDGGSSDATVALAAPLADRVVVSAPGRAVQMNYGASQSQGRLLVFLHADTSLPAAALGVLEQIALIEAGGWGRFDVTLSGSHWGLWIIAAAMNFRSRMTGIATGDQGIFITRRMFDSVGGYRDLALMEDIDLCTRLRTLAHPQCLFLSVTTSSRRWERGGIFTTVLRMWWLRLQFFCGVDSRQLADCYRAVRER